MIRSLFTSFWIIGAVSSLFDLPKFIVSGPTIGYDFRSTASMIAPVNSLGSSKRIVLT